MPVYDYISKTREEIKEFAKGKTLAVLPVSSVEQHGPHLPVGTDTYIAQDILSKSAKLTNTETTILLLPHLAFSCSGEHSNFPGTVAIKPEHLLSIIYDVGESLKKTGINNLVLFSAHGGNEHIMEIAARELRIKGMKTYCMQLFTVFGALGAAEYDVHAADSETSIMLAEHPELVHKDKIKKDHALSIEKWNSLAENFSKASEAWIAEDVGIDGVVGNPTLANEEKGTLWMQKITEEVAKTLEYLASAVD